MGGVKAWGNVRALAAPSHGSQASQEVEEMARGHTRQPLKNLTRGGNPELERITIDTSVGMIYSNIVAFFIVLTTAATLNANNVTDIQTAADAANALRPIAGDFAFALFALGIIGTGLLAIPVLAGSAAYAVAEVFGWPSTLEAKFPEARAFYVIILAATAVGFALGFTSLDPIKMLVWSAVLNGIVSVPVMTIMMALITSPSVMGRFRARRWLALVGWAATALMGLVVTGLILSFLIGK
jgi:Mn2+/Fe2+ NRAMP family transporter